VIKTYPGSQLLQFVALMQLEQFKLITEEQDWQIPDVELLK
jgi:hypothetical protein